MIKIPALFKEHLGLDNKFVISIETGGANWINLAQLQEDVSTSLTKKKFLVPTKREKTKFKHFPFHYSTSTIQEEAGRSQYKIQRG